MMKIWREIRVFQVIEQRLADQTRVIRTNDRLFEVKLDEIQRKIKEEGNTGEPRIELENTCNQQRSQDKGDVELTYTENLCNSLEDQGLTNDKIRVVEEVAEQMKTGKAPPNLRNVERKQLKSKSDEINRVLNYIVTENITPTSRLLKAAGCVVTKKLGFKTKLRKPQEPRWRKRINSLRKDITRLDRWSKNEIHNEATKDQLGNR